MPERERDGNLAAAYNRLIESPDPVVRERAARAWTDREAAIACAPPRSIARHEDPAFRMAFARIVIHYFGNDHFLGDGNHEGVVLRDAPALRGVPGTLVQGCLDLGNLLGTVWRLHQAWPGSQLVLVDDVGHDAGAPAMAEALVAAADRYARDTLTGG